ncbi:hypothetical protein C7B76_02515 [filamentous cyanobacterium CCP2]|nr:hypothetical protein C7B76_02515 [filamentous cyanobacterium CCP2]
MTKHTLGFCLNRYPDELLYSLFGRYQEVLRYPADNDLSQSLFGASTRAVVDFPSHLENFVSTLPSGHPFTVNQLINGGTLLPIYVPFSRHEQIALARNDMTHRNGMKIYGRLGILVNQRQENLKFCPLCVENDRKEFNETYWHRPHQCPGAEVCSTHQVLLERSHINPRNGGRPSYYFVAENEIQIVPARPIDLSNRKHIILLNIAQDISWLLNQENLAPGLNFLSQNYRRLLAEKGFAISSGRRIRNMTELVNCFEKFYGRELLQQLGCEIREGILESWLDRILQIGTSQKSLNPLYHLLLIRFLGYSAKDFFSLPLEIKPFGDGPWPCLNHACKFFNLPVIQEYQLIRYKDGRPRPQPTGLFKCGCGFSYYRLGPDKLPEDKFRYSGVVERGEQWEQKFTRYWNNSDVTLCEIIKIFRMREKALEQYAYHLKLDLYRQGTKGARPIDYSAQDLTQENASNIQKKYRDELLEAKSKNPDKTRSYFKKKYRKAYDFIYGNDRDWLNINFPSKKNKIRNPKKVIRRDWEEIDRELAVLVRDVGQRLRNDPSRPKRITVNVIGRQMGQSGRIQHNLSKLPLTKQSLDEFTETYAEAAMRRIDWTMKQFQEAGILPSRTLFIKKSGFGFGIGNAVSRSKEIQEAIDIALGKLESIFRQD